MSGEQEQLKHLHMTLVNAGHQIYEAWKATNIAVSTDTAFALGEATGFIAKAKALVGRDIDDGPPP